MMQAKKYLIVALAIIFFSLVCDRQDLGQFFLTPLLAIIFNDGLPNTSFINELIEEFQSIKSCW